MCGAVCARECVSGTTWACCAISLMSRLNRSRKRGKVHLLRNGFSGVGNFSASVCGSVRHKSGQARGILA